MKAKNLMSSMRGVCTGLAGVSILSLSTGCVATHVDGMRRPAVERLGGYPEHQGYPERDGYSKSEGGGSILNLPHRERVKKLFEEKQENTALVGDRALETQALRRKISDNEDELFRLRRTINEMNREEVAREKIRGKVADKDVPGTPVNLPSRSSKKPVAYETTVFSPTENGILTSPHQPDFHPLESPPSRTVRPAENTVPNTKLLNQIDVLAQNNQTLRKQIEHQNKQITTLVNQLSHLQSYVDTQNKQVLKNVAGMMSEKFEEQNELLAARSRSVPNPTSHSAPRRVYPPAVSPLPETSHTAEPSPLYDSPASYEAPSEPVRLPRPTPPEVRPSQHTVRAGEMFSQIARRYGLSINQLMSANPDIDIDRLRIGQKIKLP